MNTKQTNDPLRYDTIDSPIGTLTAAADDAGLRYLLFPNNRHEPTRSDWRRDAQSFTTLRAQLAAYFAGELQAFDLDLAPQGTPFQLSVWASLQRIPYGVTWSYRDLAIDIGNPKAVRAVGLANGRNPLPIIVPCHRVIGADGSMTGFGGGIATKQALLALEARHAATAFQASRQNDPQCLFARPHFADDADCVESAGMNLAYGPLGGPRLHDEGRPSTWTVAKPETDAAVDAGDQVAGDVDARTRARSDAPAGSQSAA